MPFYTKLIIRERDTAATKKKKRRVAERLQVLKDALTFHIKEAGANADPRHSVRIATWNLREFGKSNFGGRDFEPLYYIAEIISHFDVIALQEVRADLRELKELKKILGPDWESISTDVTDGGPGNGERMVFMYNLQKVQFKDIAGELTLKEGSKIRAAFGERIKLENGLQVKLPNDVDLSGTYSARLKTRSGQKKLDADLEISLPENSILQLPEGCKLVLTKNTPVISPGRGKATVDIPSEVSGESFRLRYPENSFDDSLRQFARTPFLIAFQSGWLKFNLCTVHIYYGDDKDEAKLEQRRSEIELLTKALAAKAKAEFKYDDRTFLGVLGDFNIIGEGHPTMEALESNGFLIPESLKAIPGSNVARDKAYDQIAFWKPARSGSYVKLEILGADIFDFFKFVYTDDDEPIYRRESAKNGLKDRTAYSKWRTYKMSDHLPMWIELRTDFSEEYLTHITE